jgi:hypothetical protein
MGSRFSMMHSVITPLWKVLMAVVEGASVTTENNPYRPTYPRRLRQCSNDAWPASNSALARLLDMLHEPGACDVVKDHAQRTLTQEMSAQLRSMPYKQFLGTQYWWLVRGVLIAERGAYCQDCQDIGVLDVHHLTYVHRGVEIFHLDDLLVLCRTCHFGRHTE